MLSLDCSDVRTPGIGVPDLGSALEPVTEPLDVGVHLPDLSTAGALLAEIVLARPVNFPATFAGAPGYALTIRTRAPTASACS